MNDQANHSAAGVSANNDVEDVEVVVVGAGQAGVAMSEHLSRRGVGHVVLERHRIAERWRSERWDSLVANGPAWHDRFPGMEFPCGPDEFPGKEMVADYFAAYAEQIDAPVRCGVDVTEVTRLSGRPGFRVATSQGVFEARYVVAATGPFQRPVIPPIIPDDAGITQLHSSAYRNPDQLPPGAVLVVGGGSSGVQIADELLDAGRRTYISIGAHGRPPRSYRGRDFCWWLGVLNKWDAEVQPGYVHTTIAVSGAKGGRTIDYRRLAAAGMTLLGTTQSHHNGRLTFASDLATNLAKGDADHFALLDEADAYIAANGLDLPEEPSARQMVDDAPCICDPILSLDLAQAGITSIIWSTGFTVDFSWLKLQAVDDDGRPVHRRGVSAEPGVYFLGLPWQTRRGSSFIWGVWHDAGYVADHIAKQRNYLSYQPSNRDRTDAMVRGAERDRAWRFGH
jgi:putative flavoprotein involved in K+ transport